MAVQRPSPYPSRIRWGFIYQTVRKGGRLNRTRARPMTVYYTAVPVRRYGQYAALV